MEEAKRPTDDWIIEYVNVHIMNEHAFVNRRIPTCPPQTDEAIEPLVSMCMDR
jgi:hypothetical protein